MPDYRMVNPIEYPIESIHIIIIDSSISLSSRIQSP